MCSSDLAAAQAASAKAAPAPKADTKADPKGGPLDMDAYALDARVALSPGRVPLGGRQHVDLAPAGKGGNEVNVRARGGEGMVVDMVQVVLGSLNVNVGGQPGSKDAKNVQADGAKVKDAHVEAGDGKTAGQIGRAHV